MPDQLERARGTSAAEEIPLAELPWSDGVLGMGFFPDEVELPLDWAWSTHGSGRVSRAG
jgi:hypothetical protein